MRIGVIGNGPSAVQSADGEFIDSLDLVVRINNFRTKGFERFVGEKTTVWATCNWRTPMKPLRKFDGVLITNNQGLHRVTGWRDCLMAYMEQQERYPAAFVDFMDVPLIQRLNRECSPLFSSGVAVIGWVLDRYSPGDIFIKGFDHFQGGAHHYMNGQKRPKGCTHNAEKEKEYVGRLERERLVVRL